MISETLSVPHKVYEVDFDDEKVQKRIEEIMIAMPFSPHLSIHFDLLCQKSRGIIWSGQNCDAITNLSATAPFSISEPSTLFPALKRYSLSKLYYDRFEGKMRLLDFVSKVSEPFLVSLFSRAYKRNLNPQKTSHEYITAYFCSDFEIPFLEQGTSCDSPEFIQYAKIHDALLQIKMTGYIDGGDSRTWITASKRHKHTLRLPYAYPPVVHFFRSCPMGLHDVFKPKKFIYRYVKGNFPQYEGIMKEAIRQKKKNGTSKPKPVSWGESALFKDFYSQCKGKGRVRDYNELIACAWIDNVIGMLEEEGIKITKE